MKKFQKVTWNYFGLIKFIRFILSDSQQPTTPACLLINHHGCCKTINHLRFITGYGDICDAVNAVLYLTEGDKEW